MVYSPSWNLLSCPHVEDPNILRFTKQAIQCFKLVRIGLDLDLGRPAKTTLDWVQSQIGLDFFRSF